jgi:hypothetical protein
LALVYADFRVGRRLCFSASSAWFSAEIIHSMKA